MGELLEGDEPWGLCVFRILGDVDRSCSEIDVNQRS